MHKTFGEIIKNLRINANQTLSDISKKTKVSNAFINYVENGHKKPTKRLLDFYIKEFQLKGKKKKELEDAYFYAINADKIDISDFNNKDKALILEIVNNFKKYKKVLLSAAEKHK